MATDLGSLRQKLAPAGQDHVLRFADRLDPAARERLGAQLSALEVGLISRLADEYVRHKPPLHLPRDIQPVRIYPRAQRDEQQRKLYRDAENRGWDLLRGGKVAAFLV